MPADVNSPLPDSRPLHRLVSRTRTLLRASWVTTGLGITLGLLLTTLAVLAVIDLFMPLAPVTLPFIDVVVPLDPLFRCLALLLVVIPSALALYHGVCRPLFRRLAPNQVARRIEKHLPGVHNRLVTAIDLEHKTDAVSPVFLSRLLSEALERIKAFRPAMILDFVSLRRSAIAVVVAAVVSLTAWALFSDRMPTALARIFLPFADIPPASGVKYAVEPGSADVLRDEEIPFVVRVNAGEPDAMHVELYGKRGARRFPLRQDRNDGNVWKVTLDVNSLKDGLENGFDYRVYGGNTWSRKHHVNVVDRPVIAGIRNAVHYPKYMKRPRPEPVPESAQAVTGPEGGEVEVVVNARGDAASGQIQLLAPTYARLPLDKQVERAWFEDRLPIGSTPGGTWDWATHSRRRVHTEQGSAGLYGHWFDGDPVGVAVGKGDVLYAYVFLPADVKPEMIALEWHDGTDWEHRAFWGKDLLPRGDGKTGTVSRTRVGDVPEAGKWVRLEVPAAKVGLENRTLRGMAFKLHDGRASWGRTGAVQVEEPAVEVIDTFDMTKADETFTGRFPLTGTGLFRVELKSPQGFKSKEMRGIRYVAVPDKPPYVVLDRKGAETVLQKPASLPLSLSAYDDYGLATIRVLSRPLAGGDYKPRTLWSAGESPRTSLTHEASLTESSALKLGEGLRYVIEAVDTKGQTARTPEFSVRVAAEGGAAEQELANFDKTQDTFQDRLAKLMGDQKKIKEQLDKLNEQNAKLSEKLAQIAEAKNAERKTDPKTGKPEAEKSGPKLTADEAAKLAELQKELAKLAAAEERNAETAKQLNEDLKKSIEDAKKLDLLPKAIGDQMSATQRAFDKMVANALRNLAKDLKDDSGAKKGTPDVPDLKQKGDRIDKELEGIKDRLEALKNARKDLKDELQKTLDALKAKMAKEDAKLTSRDLEQLKDFIAKLREQLKSAKAKSDDADNELENAKTPDDVKKAQFTKEDAEKELKRLLDKAKKLLDKKDGDKPEFPDEPFRADEKEEKVPPREQDSDEPLPAKKDKKKDKDADKKDGTKGDKDGKDEKKDDEEEPKFMPRLGGPKQKTDPRYKDKGREKKKGDKKGKDDKDGDDKSDKSGKDAADADDALKSDQESLNDLLDKIAQAAKGGKGKKGGKEGKESGDQSEAAQMAAQLRSMMQSQKMAQAKAMATAAQGMGNSRQQGQPKDQGRPPTADQRDEGNVDGGSDKPGAGEAALAKLDPDARAMIMKMPPSRQREELLRGLMEQGPEAYRGFIQDYFKRLTEAKK